MSLSELQNEIERLTYEAGQRARNARSSMTRELKPDGSIVTNADREVEAWLRPQLESLIPGSTVWGEEEGFSEPGEGGIWLVDPIDGTSNYAFGSPLWGVSVALYQNPIIVAGSVALPDLEETYTAAVGEGARRNGSMLERIPSGSIRSEELVSFSDGLIVRYPQIQWPGKMRHSGAFVVDAMFVASQRFRGLIDYKCKLYDIAASILICSELGADVRFASGEPFQPAENLVDRKIGKPFLIFPPDSGFFAEV